jgi:hypothetical protein
MRRRSHQYILHMPLFSTLNKGDFYKYGSQYAAFTPVASDGQKPNRAISFTILCRTRIPVSANFSLSDLRCRHNTRKDATRKRAGGYQTATSTSASKRSPTSSAPLRHSARHIAVKQPASRSAWRQQPLETLVSTSLHNHLLVVFAPPPLVERVLDVHVSVWSPCRDVSGFSVLFLS